MPPRTQILGQYSRRDGAVFINPHHFHESRISLCYETCSADAARVWLKFSTCSENQEADFLSRFVERMICADFDQCFLRRRLRIRLDTKFKSCDVKSKRKLMLLFFCTDRRLYCSTLNYSSLFIIICFVLENGRHVWANEYHGVNLAINVLGETYVFGQTVFKEALTVETTKKGSLTEEIKIFSSSMRLVPISVEI